MIKVLKRHVYLCALTTSVFFFTQEVDAKVQDSSSCSSLLKVYSCAALGKLSGNESHTQAANIGFSGVTAVKKFDKVTIKVGKKGDLEDNGTLQLKRSGMITLDVLAREKARIVLENVSVTGRGKNTVNGKKVDGRDNGMKQAVFGVQQGGSLFVKDGKVNVHDVYGLVMESSPEVFISNGNSGSWDWRYSDVIFENSDIAVKGRGARGLFFQGSSSQEEHMEGEALVKQGEIQFKKTTFRVPEGTAIYVDDSKRFPYITASEGSRIFASQLLEIKNNSYVLVEADASLLAGRAHVDKSSYAELELSNKSTWTVAPGKNNKWRDSSVSFVRVIDSSIFFRKPEDDHYQTLRVGRLDNDNGLDYAYVAHDARLFVNACLTTDGKNKGIKADKLLIHGNVYGKTKVYVVEASADSVKGKNLSQNEQKDTHSVSIVQVYGKAEEDSFKLAAGYVALRGAPYRYRLRAYGPGSSLEKAKDENRLVKEKSGSNNGDFWDFRLEAEYIQRSPHYSRLKTSQVKKAVSRSRAPRSIGSSAGRNYVVADSEDSVFHPELRSRAVVPQVPTYLLLPNGLFHAGLMDISNQNKQLETLRTTSSGMVEVHENPFSFFRGYGGSYRYASDLSALEYGYGGDFNYNAIEAGILLKTIENADSAISFGIMGTYGKLSLQPQDVEHGKKSAFDKWTATAYGSMQHDAGFYVDGLFSYGFLKGDVLTLARGKTATLKSNPLSASLTAGKAFMTAHKGFVFDPQIQVIYQNLRFDKASDIDGFDIEMKRPDQWVMRVGGRLTKVLATSEKDRDVSFYGKLHLTYGVGEKQTVHFKDAFRLGAFGSSLEAGLGVNARLSSQFAFHGDITYQHKLTKAGFSGVSFSGGLRYRF